MPARLRLLHAGLALAALAAGGAVAQEVRPIAQVQPVPSAALGLRPTAPPQTPAYRGSYPRVGKPVRPARSTRVVPARGVSELPPAGEQRIGPAQPGTPGPQLKPGPPLPALVTLPRRRPRIEGQEAFDALGIRAGSFLLRPAIESSVGYDTNPNRIPRPPRGSSLLKTDLALDAASDWERHQLAMVFRGSHFRYFETPAADRPDADAAVRLRLDALRDTTIDVETTGRLTTQQPGIELPVVGSSRGKVWDAGAGAGVTQRFGDVALGLKGAVGRSIYEDIPLADGTSLDQSDRDLNAYALTLRTSYDVSPSVRPFAEATLDRRIYDQAIDAGGFRRSSRGQSARAGTVLEFTSLITGEASVGYATREYDDPRLQPVDGLLANASLVWTPTALTTVRLKAGTEISETTVSGASGALVHSAGVEVTHAFRRWLSLSGLLDGSRTVYQGVPITEDRLTAALRLDFKLNRTVAIRASVAHEALDSSVVGADYTANVYLVGLRLQR